MPIALTGSWLLERKVRWWPHLHGWWALILPALLSFMVISMREIFDVAAGGLLIKSISDWISWIAGLGVSVGTVPADASADPYTWHHAAFALEGRGDGR